MSIEFNLCVTLLMFGVLNLVNSQTVTQAHYTKKSNYRFADSTNIDLCTVRKCDGSIRTCAILCNSDSTCTSFTYDSVNKKCWKDVGDVYTFGTTLTTDSSVDYVGKIQADVTSGDEILVFRGQSGNGESVADAWFDTGRASDSDMANLDLDTISKVGVANSAHYRSKWVDNWPSANIDTVRFVLYKAGVQVVYLTFNGTGSTNEDWFSQARLLDSTYTDLKTATGLKKFSILGAVYRKFLITQSGFFACDQMAWVLAEVDRDNRCTWTSMTGQPRFLYSTLTTVANFNTATDWAEADVMAIFIKLIQ